MLILRARIWLINIPYCEIKVDFKLKSSVLYVLELSQFITSAVPVKQKEICTEIKQRGLTPLIEYTVNTKIPVRKTYEEKGKRHAQPSSRAKTTNG